MLDYFVNDKYRVLQCMAQRQISLNNETIVKLSQQEIADILGFTKVKVNSIMRELKRAGYIKQKGIRGKYELTDIANAEIQKNGDKIKERMSQNE